MAFSTPPCVDYSDVTHTRTTSPSRRLEMVVVNTLCYIGSNGSREGHTLDGTIAFGRGRSFGGGPA